MRVTKKASGGGGKNGPASTMKLVIAVVFTLVFALLNQTEPAKHEATLTVSETASALAPKPSEPKPAETAAAPQPKPFDANDSSTWPKCADGQIVRADNGQCDTPAQPAPQQQAAVAVAAAPVSSNEAKAFIYEHESGNHPCKINGGAIDCNYNGNRACGIGQALPCQKLTAECSLSDYACQDAWFTRYMQNRYGTWENARAFWLANRWW